MEHAERNAIYNAARMGISLKGCTLYQTPMFPCSDCARGIIQSGITTVVSLGNEDETIVRNIGYSKWNEERKRAEIMFKEAEVKVWYYYE